MSEQQTLAASSPAEAVDVFQGQQPTLTEYMQYRQDGTVPERFKSAETSETATDDAPEETAESAVDETETASESESEEEAQEPPQKPQTPAQKRILQLLAEKKELQRKLDAAKPGVTAEPPPAQQSTQQQTTRPEPTADDKNADGSLKYDTYEKYVKDLARWEGEQLLAEYQRNQAQQAQQRELQARLAKAEAKYDNFRSIAENTARSLNDPAIPGVVRAMINDSEDFEGLIYKLGSDSAELENFINTAKQNPGKAIRHIALVERSVAESATTADIARNDKGQFTSAAKAPEPKKTSAPKPPSPVSGGASKAFDVSDESLSADEWARQRNAKLNKS